MAVVRFRAQCPLRPTIGQIPTMLLTGWHNSWIFDHSKSYSDNLYQILINYILTRYNAGSKIHLVSLTLL